MHATVEVARHIKGWDCRMGVWPKGMSVYVFSTSIPYSYSAQTDGNKKYTEHILTFNLPSSWSDSQWPWCLYSMPICLWIYSSVTGWVLTWKEPNLRSSMKDHNGWNTINWLETLIMEMEWMFGWWMDRFTVPSSATYQVKSLLVKGQLNTKSTFLVNNVP